MTRSCSMDCQAYHQAYGVQGCCLAASLTAAKATTVAVIAEPKIVVGTATSAEWIARAELKLLANLESHARYLRWSVVWATAGFAKQVTSCSFVVASSIETEPG